MKVVLKQNWDVPFYPPVSENSDQGNFVGREKEVLPLINDILRKKSGSILVSGYRGVGKTSLVYKALFEVKKKQENTILIFLNGNQLKDDHDVDYISGNSKKIDQKKVLENLIRRLYATFEENCANEEIEENTDQIKKLYRKTMAKEFRKVETNIENHEFLHGIEKKETLEFSLNESNLKELMIVFFSFFFAVVIQFTDILPTKFWNNIIPLILIFHVPFSIKYISNIEKKHKEEDTKRFQEEEIYQFDNNIGNLEFDLEKIHRDLSLNKKKLIYVIDELDKIGTEEVKEIFNYFKNLFTLSDAQFIFICGEDLYNKIYGINNTKNSSSEEDSYRPKEYTYFTSKFFLSRPVSKDLEAFFENIVEDRKIEDGEDETYFDVLKRSLLFESKNDFYDLKTYIRSRITNFEDEKPIIEYNKIDRKDITKARLQEAICILFEQKYMSIRSSKWRENEEILRELFNYSDKIYNSLPNSEFIDPIDSSQNFPVVDEAKRDFNKLLERCGAFKQLENKIYGNDKKLYVYQYLGEVQSKIPLQLEGWTEFEENFVRLYENYFDYITSILNSYNIHQNEEKLVAKEFLCSVDKRNEAFRLANKFKLMPKNIFEDYGKIYETLTHNDISNNENINRDIVEEKTQELRDKINIIIQSLPNIVGRIIQTLNPELNSNNGQGRNLLENMPQEYRNILLADNYCYILANKEFTKKVLIINGKEEILKTVNSELKNYMLVSITDLPIDYNDKIPHRENLYFVNKSSPKMLQNSIVHLLDRILIFKK
jgi:hypothetical protein